MTAPHPPGGLPQHCSGGRGQVLLAPGSVLEPLAWQGAESQAGSRTLAIRGWDGEVAEMGPILCLLGPHPEKSQCLAGGSSRETSLLNSTVTWMLGLGQVTQIMPSIKGVLGAAGHRKGTGWSGCTDLSENPVSNLVGPPSQESRSTDIYIHRECSWAPLEPWLPGGGPPGEVQDRLPWSHILEGRGLHPGFQLAFPRPLAKSCWHVLALTSVPHTRGRATGPSGARALGQWRAQASLSEPAHRPAQTLPHLASTLTSGFPLLSFLKDTHCDICWQTGDTRSR